jgi:hypothetical protein
MKLELIGVMLLVVSFGAAAGDTIPVRDVAGNCILIVPSDWSASQASARSPDKGISVVLITMAPSLNTLSDARKLLLINHKNDKVTKDSHSEFEMQGTSSGKPSFVRAVPAAGRVCYAEIVYATGTAADAQKIIETLRTTK